MAVDLEKPETVGGKPVVVVSIENHGVLRRYSRPAQELLEYCTADDISIDLVLQVFLPVESDSSGNMPGLVCL